MKKTIGFIIGIIVLLVAFFVFTNVDNQPREKEEREQGTQEILANEESAVFELSEAEYDFGIIKQSGGVVQHEFPFTYNGGETVSVVGVPTSCACTSAEINKETLNPGDNAVITVSFDPNLHVEPEGKFFKTITLMTDPAIEDTPELKIWAEIDLDLGSEAFKLQTHED